MTQRAKYHWQTITVVEGGTERTMRLKMDGPKPTAAQRRKWAAAWCSCTEPGDPIYYERTGGHGYDCSKCGKILQTG